MWHGMIWSDDIMDWKERKKERRGFWFWMNEWMTIKMMGVLCDLEVLLLMEIIGSFLFLFSDNKTRPRFSHSQNHKIFLYLLIGLSRAKLSFEIDELPYTLVPNCTWGSLPLGFLCFWFCYPSFKPRLFG